jgi:putative restriction endonuclease
MDRTQTGSRYDLTAGEGLRVWQDCLAAAASLRGIPAAIAEAPVAARYGEPVLRAPRLGQGIFRVAVLDAYGRACAVTGEHSLPVVDSAHIHPFALGGENDVRNGIALRTDLHRLFDRGYVTIDDSSRLVVGQRLKQDFDNGRSYYGLHGTKLAPPQTESFSPDPIQIRWHQENVFLG